MADQRVGVVERGRPDVIGRHQNSRIILNAMSHPTETRRGPEPPDISEKGGMKGGQPQRADTRLFMQLLAFGGCADTAPLVDALERAGIDGVLYEDVNDPRGVALLTFSEDPGVLRRSRPAAVESGAVRRARAEAGIHDDGPDLLASATSRT